MKASEQIQAESNRNYEKILDERNKKHHRYSQNENVYRYFDNINRQRIEKQKNLEHSYIDEASRRKKESEQRRDDEKKMKKNELNNEIKRTLDDQVRYHSQQALNNKKSNPE